MLQKVTEVAQNPNKEELEVVLSGPAHLANRLYVTLTPSGLRIAFAERQAENPIFFRAAVLLSFQDAGTLHKIIDEALKRHQAALDSALAPPPKVAKAN